MRGGLQLLIERQPDMEVVAEAEDGVDAFEQALETQPDLCVLDVSMPRMTGLQAARQIRAHLPGTQVLALSMHDDERYVFDALKAGAVRLRAQARGRPGARSTRSARCAAASRSSPTRSSAR